MTADQQDIVVKGVTGLSLSFFSEMSLEEAKEYVEIGVQLTIGVVTVLSFLIGKLNKKK